MTREQWLLAAVEHMRPWFNESGKDFPVVQVSIGYAKRPGKGIGWCYAPGATEGSVPTIFVSPELAAKDPVKLLGVLLHEIIHAVDKGESGHRGWFASTAKSLGLEGKMTATTVGMDLAADLGKLANELGDFPHKALTGQDVGGRRVGAQTNRQLKIECPEGCGYKLRGSRQVLDMGMPNCPQCDAEMVEG